MKYVSYIHFKKKRQYFQKLYSEDYSMYFCKVCCKVFRSYIWRKIVEFTFHIFSEIVWLWLFSQKILLFLSHTVKINIKYIFKFLNKMSFLYKQYICFHIFALYVLFKMKLTSERFFYRKCSFYAFNVHWTCNKTFGISFLRRKMHLETK